MSVITFQYGEWKWQDKSSVPYINLATRYQFPTKHEIFHWNQSIIEPTSAESRLTRHAGQDDGMCSAALVAPDFSGTLIFPIDCSKNLSSRYLCVPRTQYNKDSIPPHAIGYNKIPQNNGTILKISMHICPDGYDISNRNECLKLVHSRSQYPKWYFNCTNWADIYFRINCTAKENTAQVILDDMNKTCQETDNSAYVYGGEHEVSDQDMNPLNNYLFQVLPVSTRTFHSGRDVAFVRNNTMACPRSPVCVMYPLHKHNALALDDNDALSFILCAREQIIPPAMEASLLFEPFTCTDCSFIAISLQCDGKPNCPNAEDEDHCSEDHCSDHCSVCTAANIDCFTECVYPACVCSDYYYQCTDGGCMTFDKLCDGQLDCPKGEDERGCVIDQKKKHIVSVTVQDVDLSTGFCRGKRDHLPCVSQSECYSIQSLCHYDTQNGVMIHCADGTHLGGYCVSHACNHRYKCLLSYCIPTHKVCDGVADCRDGDDEVGCDDMACPGHLRCSHTTFCVPPHEICDGEPHCPFREDEKFCMLGPTGCSCRGNIILCNNINPTTLYTISSAAVIILNDLYSMFEYLEKNMLHSLVHTFYIKLNYGKFHELLKDGFSALAECKLLRWLQLNNQGMTVLNEDFINIP